mmetsp:Transcript_48193/g.125988  ORF Transcript_48193/g.125988 Transcript_48193/m.125988 type:complete len:249 (-) Transcript_48193:61-807(-)
MPEEVVNTAAPRATVDLRSRRAVPAREWEVVRVHVLADFVCVLVVRDHVLDVPRGLTTDPRGVAEELTDHVHARVARERAMRRVMPQVDHQQIVDESAEQAADRRAEREPPEGACELEEEEEPHEHQLGARGLVRALWPILEVLLDHRSDVGEEWGGALGDLGLEAVGRDVVRAQTFARLVEDVVRLEEDRAVSTLTTQDQHRTPGVLVDKACHVIVSAVDPPHSGRHFRLLGVHPGHSAYLRHPLAQ